MYETHYVRTYRISGVCLEQHCQLIECYPHLILLSSINESNILLVLHVGNLHIHLTMEVSQVIKNIPNNHFKLCFQCMIHDLHICMTNIFLSMREENYTDCDCAPLFYLKMANVESMFVYVS